MKFWYSRFIFCCFCCFLHRFLISSSVHFVSFLRVKLMTCHGKSCRNKAFEFFVWHVAAISQMMRSFFSTEVIIFTLNKWPTGGVCLNAFSSYKLWLRIFCSEIAFAIKLRHERFGWIFRSLITWHFEDFERSS